MSGGSKKQTVGYWYKRLWHAGLCKGPIDAFLEFRGAEKTAWKGGLIASGTISIDAPKLWGGEKDQGGIVSDVDLQFGEPSQTPNAYLLANLGDQIPAWRGLTTLVFKGGKYGAMNPNPQLPSFKVRRIKEGWDGGAWYPEKSEIVMATWLLETRLVDLDAITNAATNTAGGLLAGVEIVTNNPLVVLTIRPNLDGGAPYIAYSYWGVPAYSGGNTGSTYRWNVIRNGVVDDSLGVGGINDGYVAARQRFIDEVGEQVISGASSYVFYISDSPINDNTGGLSLEVDLSDGLVAMNPAHALYYSRTSADAGREPTANIDTASLTAAADTLHAEGFGICTTRDPGQESPEEFEDRISRLIDGAFSRDPITGKWHLDLARGDYVLEDLPILADDDIIEFREIPATLDNAVNSVSITYFDPEKKETITTPPVQAMALVAEFGTIHQTIEYLEIPTAELAARVAQRELNARATPTRSYELVCTRRPYAWRPGTYFRLQVPKRGIADLVCILAEKESGGLKSGAIRLKATQDIYSLPTVAWAEVEPGVDTGPPQTPVPITLQAAFEAPYIELVAALSRADLEALPEDAGYLLTVAADPAASIHYTILVDAGGGYEEAANGDWCPTATVVEAADWLDTAFTLAAGSRLDEVAVGSVALWDGEIVRVDALDTGAGTITLARGCADTLPAQHLAGSRLWFYQDHAGADPTEYTGGEALAVKLLTNTGSQQLPLASATAMPVGILPRAINPYPPANIQINGAYYPLTDVPAADPIVVTWAHRDRVLQSDQIVDWLQASIGPEPGVTYSGILGEVGGGTLETITGVSGATMSFAAPLLFDTDLYIELWSVRGAYGSVHWIHQFRTSAGTNLAWSINNPYSYQVVPSGGTGPYTYAVQSGSLPAGLSLNASTGEISGTPTAAVASHFFLIRITDSLAATEDQPYSMDVVADPHWADVVLLCGFNGADGSTTIVDESATPVALTVNGNAQLDTAWKEHGTASLLLDGSGDYVSAADSADWTPGSGSYTWEATMRPATAPGTSEDAISHYDSSGSNRSWILTRESDGKPKFIYSSNGGGPAAFSGDAAIAQHAVAKVSVTYDGGTGILRMFVDGVLQSETGTVGGFYNPGELLLIGARHSGSSKVQYWNGWLDEIRLTKGVCRYTAEYTPDPYPFPRG